MKHVVRLLSDVVNNGLGPAYFVSLLVIHSLGDLLVLGSNCSIIDSQDLKETSRIKSSFIHATRGGWEQLPLLKDQLLESVARLYIAAADTSDWWQCRQSTPNPFPGRK